VGSGPEWVAVGAGRIERTEYPGGIVIPSAPGQVMAVKEVTRRLGQPSCPDLACGLVHQLEIRSDPVGRLRAAMPSTISAADQLRRSDCPPAIRCQAGDLLLTLAAVECHASLGGPAAAPPALLRDLVIITARLAGYAWLEANADDTAAFTAVQRSWLLPPLPELDQILARVLSDRFGLPSSAAAA
jgi:hypothetical protein